MRRLLSIPFLFLLTSGGPIDSRDFVEEARGLLDEISEESGNVHKEVEDNEELTILEGDMAVPKAESIEDMQASALKGQHLRWPNAEIPFVIHTGINSKERQVIAQAMAYIQHYTCVTFRYAGSGDEDYVYFIKRSGCSSMIGRQGGQQLISLGNGCYNKAIVMHEILHALGFIHEQSRADRDEYVQINWGNIEQDMKHNFDKYPWGELVLMDTPYDYASVMHYGQDAFSSNGQPTIIPRKGGASEMGQRRGLSQINIDRINRLYNCRTSRPASRGPQWQKGDAGMYWALSCDFSGYDVGSARSSGEDCGGICSRHKYCTHFTWSRINGGTCFLKAGVPTGTVPNCLNANDWPGAVCGTYGPPNRYGLTEAVNCR